MSYLDEAQNRTRIPGLWPAQVNTEDPPNFSSTFFTLGAWADSLYEYLPKVSFRCAFISVVVL